MISYVATPYSKYPDGLHRAFIDASIIIAKLIDKGIYAYSPICHTHPVAIYGGLDPLDHNLWLEFDQAMMKVSSSLIVAHLEGWNRSFGIAHEIEFFSAAGKPIYDLDPMTMEMTMRP